MRTNHVSHHRLSLVSDLCRDWAVYLDGFTHPDFDRPILHLSEREFCLLISDMYDFVRCVQLKRVIYPE